MPQASLGNDHPCPETDSSSRAHFPLCRNLAAVPSSSPTNYRSYNLGEISAPLRSYRLASHLATNPDRDLRPAGYPIHVLNPVAHRVAGQPWSSTIAQDL